MRRISPAPEEERRCGGEFATTKCQQRKFATTKICNNEYCNNENTDENVQIASLKICNNENSGCCNCFDRCKKSISPQQQPELHNNYLEGSIICFATTRIRSFFGIFWIVSEMQIYRFVWQICFFYFSILFMCVWLWNSWW